MKCAFYEKEITPPLGSAIPGYFEPRFGSDVLDRLYVKAVVTESGGSFMAIAAIDSCHMLLSFRDAVAERVQSYTGIKAENILICANHSHTGIPSMKPENVFYDKAYTDMLILWTADAIILAYKRLGNCEVSFGLGEVLGISFCRDYIMKNSTPRTNPGRKNPDIIKPCAEIDYDLPVLCFKNPNGTPMGAIISFACHQDCVSGDKYSGDFSSVLAKELKKVYGESFVCIFVAGACGNINHVNVSESRQDDDHYIMMGKKIAAEAVRVISDSLPVTGDEIKTKYEILKIKRRDITKEDIEKAKKILAEADPEEKVLNAEGDITVPMAKRLLAIINGAAEFDIPVMVIKVGDCVIYGFPCETFNFFAKKVVGRSPFKRNIISTLSNTAVGYVVTEDLFYDTIYESRIGTNILEAGAGNIISDKLIEMAERI
jgi:neutral ceramidase